MKPEHLGRSTTTHTNTHGSFAEWGAVSRLGVGHMSLISIEAFERHINSLGGRAPRPLARIKITNPATRIAKFSLDTSVVK
jgi:hypothetical protein